MKELDLSIKEGLALLGLKEHTDLPSVDQYVSMKSSFGSLRTLLVKRDTLVATQTDCQNAWDSAERPTGMDSSEGISAALLDNEKELEFTKNVEDYQAKRAINESELDTDDVKEAEGKSEVDVGKDKEKFDAEMNRFNIEKRTHVVAKARLTDLKTSSATLADAKEEYTNFASSVSDLQWVDEHLLGVNKGGNMQMDIVAMDSSTLV